MAEATALDAPEPRKPAGLGVMLDMLQSCEGGEAAASHGGWPDDDGLRGMLPTCDGETGTARPQRRSRPLEAFEANDVATPLMGNQAAGH